MTKLTGQAQPGPPAAGARRGMRTGTGIFLITAGAILRFALAAGSPHGLNVHVVGVILMLAGLLGLLLPRLAGGPLRPDRLRRWVRPGQPEVYDEAPTGVDAGVYDDRPALVQRPRRPRRSCGWSKTSPVRRITGCPETLWYAAQLRRQPSRQQAGRKAAAGAGVARVS